MGQAPRGRPRRYAEYDRFLEGLPRPSGKRPSYVHGIGVFKGARGDTAWVKIYLRHGGAFRDKTYRPGQSVEIKLGNLQSFSWQQLEAKRDELQGKADRAEPLEETPPVGFSEWTLDWLDRAANRVESTETIGIHVRKHLIPHFGDRPIASITTHDVNVWIAAQLRDLAPGTVQRQFNTLRAILHDAGRAGHLERNPCSGADHIRGVEARQRFLSGEEVAALLAVAEEVAEWLPDFLLWALHSGMRKSEILNLTWGDVRDVGQGRMLVQVRKSKADRPRMVGCNRSMREVLERQGQRRQEDSDRVFPISKMTLRRKWEQARKRAGLEDVNLHDMRRTHATHLVAAGVDLKTVAERIGHSDLTMLQRHYAALVGEKAAEAADRFQGVADGWRKPSGGAQYADG